LLQRVLSDGSQPRQEGDRLASTTVDHSYL
jgi:hypothetical protein